MNGIKLYIMPAFFWLCAGYNAYSQDQANFITLRQEFVAKLKRLDIPELQLSFKDNMTEIVTTRDVAAQRLFFTQMEKKLQAIDEHKLKGNSLIDYKLIRYEVSTNLGRLQLQQINRISRKDIDQASTLYELPDGKNWYVYFLKRWVELSIEPMDIYELGMKQTERAQKSIEHIRSGLKLNQQQFSALTAHDTLFLKDTAGIISSFIQIKTIVQQNLGKVFYPYNLPDVAIKQGTNAALKQTPGYYSDNTFYFNYFDEPYSRSYVDWLYLHEAVPGHHLQLSIADTLRRTAVQGLFHYSGYSEGWAAYVEEIGKELGAYANWYTELGKWDWDLVRSMRLVLDVGINYLGWNDNKAMQYWRENLPDKDQLAVREIARVKRWPAQAVTYKYGAAKILEWKDRIKSKTGTKFNEKVFHDDILKYGSLPFSILETLLCFEPK